MASLSSLRVKWSTKNLSQTNPFNKNVFGLFIFVFLWNATNNLGVVCKFLQTDSIVTEEIEQRQPSVSIINAHHYPDHRYYLLQRKALRESDESGIENFDKNRQALNFVTESFLDDRKRSTRNRDFHEQIIPHNSSLIEILLWSHQIISKSDMSYLD
ncbi:hypothetical protein SSS_04495 [Sarcoptes scabiei]|uniref:Uncharacterized protein n=1 Tax=Sarcoptes scabiei TaxID=52283 RepID=A0A834RHF5_SARSC|nr:hypothetical protein SSS_04495 [Sarcoptes scabiei]